MYSEILFRGEHILKERERVHRESMISAAFTAWQVIGIQLKKPPPWDKYLRSMGLAESKKATKDDLKREENVARENVRRIMEKARNVSGTGTI